MNPGCSSTRKSDIQSSPLACNSRHCGIEQLASGDTDDSLWWSWPQAIDVRPWSHNIVWTVALYYLSPLLKSNEKWWIDDQSRHPSSEVEPPRSVGKLWHIALFLKPFSKTWTQMSVSSSSITINSDITSSINIILLISPSPPYPHPDARET